MKIGKTFYTTGLVVLCAVFYTFAVQMSGPVQPSAVPVSPVPEQPANAADTDNTAKPDSPKNSPASSAKNNASDRNDAAAIAHVRQKLAEKYPNIAVQRVVKMPTDGSDIFYIETGKSKLYTNKNVDFLILNGVLFSGENEKSKELLKDRATEIRKSMYSELPLSYALSYKYGNGSREMVIFEDPDCHYCQALTKTLAKAGDTLDVTVHIFPMPIVKLHPDAVEKALYIMCTPDPSRSWHNWMISSNAGWDSWKANNPKKTVCTKRGKSRLLAGVKLADAMKFDKTPTLLFPTGEVIEGVPGLDKIKALLDKQ